MSPSSQLWRVIGGTQQGGIIVRDGRGLDASKKALRLETGAVVEEQELVEERLHYRKFAGVGPESGWVSTRTKEKDLVVRVPVSEVLSAVSDAKQDTMLEPEVHAFSVEQSEQTESAAQTQDIETREATGAISAAASTQEGPACVKTELELGRQMELTASVHEMEASDNTQESLACAEMEEASCDVTDVTDAIEAVKESNPTSELRPDQINRGSYWFNFDDMSGEEDSVPPPLLDESARRAEAARMLDLSQSAASQETASNIMSGEQEATDGDQDTMPLLHLDASAGSDEPAPSSDLRQSEADQETAPSNPVSVAGADQPNPVPCDLSCPTADQATLSPNPGSVDRADEPTPAHDLTHSSAHQETEPAAKLGDSQKEEAAEHILAEMPLKSSEVIPELASIVPGAIQYAAESADQTVERMQRAKDLSSKVEPILEEPVLCSDSAGVPRGRCLNCNKCDGCALDFRPYVCWIGCRPLDCGQTQEAAVYRIGDNVEVRDKLGEDWVPGVVISSQPTVQVRPNHWTAHQRNFQYIRPTNAQSVDAPLFLEHCQRCGCAVAEHEKLQDWKKQAEESLGRYRRTGTNTKRRLPERSRVPLDALNWSFDDVAIFVLTAGVFDPRRDGSGPIKEPSVSSTKLLVSVVTPTSHKRHNFHPLLYKAFCNQTYEPKELVVVDTGDAPSDFLLERARDDPRIVYRWFDVKDARQQNLAECLIQPPAANQNNGAKGKGMPFKGLGKGTAQNLQAGRLSLHLQGKVRGGMRIEGWTLGMKRNLACHLARGSIIAHFDDDDLYASCYLEVMVPKLCQALGHSGNALQPEELRPGAATLKDWHVFDLSDQTFGFVSPLTDPLVEEHMREPYAYGFGFTYIYTRAAWQLVMFADVEWSEDGHFVQELMSWGHQVKLIHSTTAKGTADALAAHSYHRDTTSGGEFVDFQINTGRRPVTRAIRLGTKVEAPSALMELVPMAAEIAKKVGLKKGDNHPLRQQLSEIPVGSEVSLTEKQMFMRTDVGRQVANAAATARRPQHAANNFNQFQWRPGQPAGAMWKGKSSGRGVGSNLWGDKHHTWKGAGRASPFAQGKGGFVPLWGRQ